MDCDNTTDDSGQNLMHQTNEKKCIEENAKVIQHDPYFKNADEGDDEENLESPHSPILAVNVANNNAFIFQRKMYSKVIQGLGLALHFPLLTATIQNNEEYSILVIKYTYKLSNLDKNSTHVPVVSKSIEYC